MKHIFIALFFMVFCSCAALAQQSAPTPGAMRISVREGEELLTNFPSAHLTAGARVNVVLPAGYDGHSGRYNVVYILSDEGFDKARLSALFGAKDFIFVSANTSPGDRAAFLTSELLPYIETNYKADDTPQSRVLLAAGGKVGDVFALLGAPHTRFLNAAVLLQESTPMPRLGGQVPQNLKIYAAGRAGNIARLQPALEGAGLRFIQNFVSQIYTPASDALEWQHLDLNYFFADTKAWQPRGVQAYLSAAQIAPGGERVAMWARVKTAAGPVDYVPGEVKFSPPFLSWDLNSATLGAIFGASGGKVKISAPLYFYKKPFKSAIKIVI